MRFRDCRGLRRCCELICSLLGRKVSVWDYMRGMYVQGVSGPYYDVVIYEDVACMYLMLPYVVCCMLCIYIIIYIFY